MNNKEIFTKLYQENIDKVYRFIYLKVDNKDIAEDLTADLFSNIWKNIIQKPDFIDKIDNIQAFLYKSAYNKVIDFYKLKKKEILTGEEIDTITSAIIEPEQNQAIINIEMEEAKKLLDKLDKKYRDIIILYYIEELSTKEIAQITGKSEVNIRVIISRGLKKLKEGNR